MSVGFPTAPLTSSLRWAGGGTVDNPQQIQRSLYLDRKPVQTIPTTAAVSKTHNCVCVGIDGFRTTMSFIRIDPNSSLALKDLMQYPF